MSVTLDDFQALQEQVLHLRAENADLQQQIDISKRRSQMTGPQIAESLKQNNLQLRVLINQRIKERDTLTEKLKHAKMIQFLKNQSIGDAAQMPDATTVPEQVRPIAENVLALAADIREQAVRRSILDAQISELSKKTKSLGRSGESLQAQIMEQRDIQRKEIEELEERRGKLQKLEVEVAELGEIIVKSKNDKVEPRANPETIEKRIRTIEETMSKRRSGSKKTIDELTEQIGKYNRELEDGKTAVAVLEKKLEQREAALKAEITRRKSGNNDCTVALFSETQRLIGDLARSQEVNWELEERVAFSRNSAIMMAKEVALAMVGRNSDLERIEKAKSMISRIAEIERLMKKA